MSSYIQGLVFLIQIMVGVYNSRGLLLYRFNTFRRKLLKRVWTTSRLTIKLLQHQWLLRCVAELAMDGSKLRDVLLRAAIWMTFLDSSSASRTSSLRLKSDASASEVSVTYRFRLLYRLLYFLPYLKLHVGGCRQTLEIFGLKPSMSRVPCVILRLELPKTKSSSWLTESSVPLAFKHSGLKEPFLVTRWKASKFVSQS